MSKKLNPYHRLMNEALDWANKVVYAKRRTMWVYPKAKLNERWQLRELWERTKAAEQIDFEVRLIASEEGLKVQYIEKRPDRPPSYWERH